MLRLPEWAYKEMGAGGGIAPVFSEMKAPTEYAGCGHRFAIRQRWQMEPCWPQPFPDEVRLINQIAASLPYAEDEIHDSDGILIPITPDLPAYVAYLILNDAYEHGDISLVREYVDAGDKIAMLGAGIGVVATALAQQCGDRVIVVDANPEMADAIETIAKINHVELDFVHGVISDCLLGDSTTFTISNEFWSSSLSEETRLPKKTIMAPAINVLELVETNEINTLFIDIEGGEIFLFDTEIPDRVKKLFVEVHTPNIGPKMYAKVLNDLYRQGFKLVDSRGLTLYLTR